MGPDSGGFVWLKMPSQGPLWAEYPLKGRIFLAIGSHFPLYKENQATEAISEANSRSS